MTGTLLLGPGRQRDPYPFTQLQRRGSVWQGPGTDGFVVELRRIGGEATARVEDFSSTWRLSTAVTTDFRSVCRSSEHTMQTSTRTPDCAHRTGARCFPSSVEAHVVAQPEIADIARDCVERAIELETCRLHGRDRNVYRSRVSSSLIGCREVTPSACMRAAFRFDRMMGSRCRSNACRGRVAE